MSNGELKHLVLGLFGLHLAVLALGLWRPGRPAVLGLSALDAAAVLLWLALHPTGFRPPVDWPVVALGAFEGLVLIAVAMAARGLRPAVAAVWFAFAVHLIASGLAVAFALTFKITRLI
jgi:hypothetical protein